MNKVVRPVILLLAASLTVDSACQVSSQNIPLQLRSQQDVNALRDCTIIPTDVLLGSSNCNEPSTISSLADASRITTITGKLKVSCLSTLSQLDGLSSLTQLGGLEIDSNFALRKIATFPQLSRLDGPFIVTNNVNLVTIAGFDMLTTVRDYVQIDRNWNLTSLSGLERLHQINGESLLGGYFALSLVYNFRLDTLLGFRRLTVISEGTVHIEGNRALCFAGYPTWEYGHYKIRPQSGALDKGIDWRTRIMTSNTRLWRWEPGNIPTLLIQKNGENEDCGSAQCASGCQSGAGCLGPVQSNLCGICREDQYIHTCSQLGPPETSTGSADGQDWWPPFDLPYLIIFIIIIVVVVTLIVLATVCIYRCCKQRDARRKGSFRLANLDSTEHLPTDPETGLDDGGIAMHAIRRIDLSPTKEANNFVGSLSTMPEQTTALTDEQENFISEKEREKKDKEERKLQLKQQKELEKQEKEQLKRDREQHKLLEKQMKKQHSNPKFDADLVIENEGRMDSLLLKQPSSASMVPVLVASHVHINYPRENLTLGQEICKGTNFQVFEATAQRIVSGLKKSRVVVKQLKNSATNAEKKKFLRDIQHIKTLEQHDNLVSLLGLCTDIDPFLAIVEHCTQGNLKTYLVRHRWDATAVRERGLPVRMAVDIAAGLDYLHQHNHIHNDMAARNCQVAIDSSIKVGDYGLSQEVFRDDYHLIESLNRIVPIRWLAPEMVTIDENSVTLTAQTKASNVWSFGVTLWEVMSFARKPYEKLSNEEVMHSVIRDETTQLDNPLEPGHKPQESYIVMQSCWLPHENRPTMTQIQEALEDLRGSGVLPDKFCDQFDPEKRMSLLRGQRPDVSPPSWTRDAVVKQSPPSVALSRPRTGSDPSSTACPTIVPLQIKLAAAMDVSDPSANSSVIRGSPPISAAAAAKRTAVLQALAFQQSDDTLQLQEATPSIPNDEQAEGSPPRRSALRAQLANIGPKKTVKFHETNLTQTIDVSIVSLRSLEDFDLESSLANAQSDEDEDDEPDGVSDTQIYREDTLTRKRQKDQHKADTRNLLATDLDTVGETKDGVSASRMQPSGQAASGASGEEKAALIW